MKVTQHGDYLIKLTRLGMFNSFLVRQDDGFTAVDTNMGGSAAGILAAAAAHGLPITRIALTHAHSDHAASLDDLHAALPQAEVAMSVRTDRFLQGEMALQPDEPQAELKGGYVTAQTRAARTLAPGDRIGALRVIAAPGHTPDQIAFFDERDGTLIAGDAFQTQAGLAVAGVMRWLFPFPALATWHLPTAVATARRLLELQPTRLAVGHGRVLEQPQAAIARAIAEAEERLHGQAQVA